MSKVRSYNSDASIHQGGDFTTNSVIDVHGAKFVEVKPKGRNLESTEMPTPTAKELEPYRELEAVKQDLIITREALSKKEITRKPVAVKSAGSSCNAFAVQYPVRSDSQAWKMQIAKLKTCTFLRISALRDDRSFSKVSLTFRVRNFVVGLLELWTYN